MLKYKIEDHTFYSFEDFNPSIIGHKIRWIVGHNNGNPHDEKGAYFTVSSYDEQCQEIHTEIVSASFAPV